MKIVITESQLRLINEAVGVPENITATGKELYNIVKELLQKITTKKDKYVFGPFGVNIVVSDTTFTQLELTISVNTVDNYDGKPVITSMGVINPSRFSEKIKMNINLPRPTINLDINFVVSEDWNPSDLYDTFISNEHHNTALMSHEIMHKFRRAKKQTGLLGDVSDYQTYASGGLGFGVEVIDQEFMRYSYFIQQEENVVRPPEIASRMFSQGITKETFYDFIMNDVVMEELKRIRNFTFEYFIKKLNEQMDQVDNLLKYAGVYTPELTNTIKIKLTLDLLYMNLVNSKMNIFANYIFDDQEKMFFSSDMFSQLFGKKPSDNKLEVMEKYRKHLLKYENRKIDYFKDECERFNYVATKLMKRIAKIYSLLPGDKEQTNESINNWELHQKVVEKKYGKRPIDTKFNKFVTK